MDKPWASSPRVDLFLRETNFFKSTFCSLTDADEDVNLVTSIMMDKQNRQQWRKQPSEVAHSSCLNSESSSESTLDSEVHFVCADVAQCRPSTAVNQSLLCAPSSRKPSSWPLSSPLSPAPVLPGHRGIHQMKKHLLHAITLMLVIYLYRIDAANTVKRSGKERKVEYRA